MKLLPLLAATVGAQTLPLRFDVLSGPSLGLAEKHTSQYHHTKRDSTVSLGVTDQLTFFMAQVSIGGQTFNTLLDTGSSDFWVYGSTNPYCESGSETKKKRFVKQDIDSVALLNDSDKRLRKRAGDVDCASWGTIDLSSSSSTFKSDDRLFLIQYGDSTFARGVWGTSDVSIGGTTVSDLTMAVANSSNSSSSVLGIGLQGLEASNQAFMDDYGGAFTYQNLPMALKTQGVIDKMMYSLYIDSSSSEGAVLFGGIDHSKYTGELVTLSLLTTGSGSTPTTFDVPLKGVSITDNGKTSDVSSFDSPISALLDSGTSLTYLPQDTVDAIMTAIGAVYSDQYGLYLTKCASLSTSLTLNYEFDGVTIKVPIKDFIEADQDEDDCAVLITADTRYVLGDAFLRAAYVVFDLEDHEVQIAQLQASDKENIEIVGASSSSSKSSTKTSTTKSTSSTSTTKSTSTTSSTRTTTSSSTASTSSSTTSISSSSSSSSSATSSSSSSIPSSSSSTESSSSTSSSIASSSLTSSSESSSEASSTYSSTESSSIESSSSYSSSEASSEASSEITSSSTEISSSSISTSHTSSEHSTTATATASSSSLPKKGSAISLYIPLQSIILPFLMALY